MPRATCAKNIVAAGLARQCELQLAYAIGVAHPVSRAGGYHAAPASSRDERLAQAVREAALTCGPTPSSHELDLRRPIYRQTAAYGHFGRTDVDLPWERLDYVDALKRELSC